MSRVNVRVGADTTGLERGLDRARGSVQTWGRQIRGMMLRFFAVGAIVAGLRNTSQELDRIAKLARRGLDVGFLQDLSLTAQRAGTDLDRAARGVERLVSEVNRAGGPSQQFQRELEAIGLSVSELQGMNPQQLFGVVAERIGNLGTETEQLASITGLLGNRYSDLLPLIQEIFENQLAEAPKVTGYNIAQIEKFNDSITDLTTRIKSVLAPGLVFLIALFSTLWHAVTAIATVLTVSVPTAIGIFRRSAQNLLGIARTLVSAFQSVGDAVRAAMTMRPGQARRAAREAMAEISKAIEEFSEDRPKVFGDDFKADMKVGAQAIREATDELVEAGKQIGDAFRDGAGDVGRVPAGRDRTGVRTIDDGDDEEEKARERRIDDIERERGGILNRLDELAKVMTDPGNMAVQSIQRVGGGGGFASPNEDRVFRVTQKQLDRLTEIREEIRGLREEGGVE